MGLVFHPRIASDALEWAQHRSQKILLMATDGPSASTKNCCQCPWMGPLLLLKTLPMAMNGPSVSPKNCCQRLQMGPASQPKNTTDGHEWAQFYEELLPMPLDGPIVAAENTTDGHEWA